MYCAETLRYFSLNDIGLTDVWHDQKHFEDHIWHKESTFLDVSIQCFVQARLPEERASSSIFQELSLLLPGHCNRIHLSSLQIHLPSFFCTSQLHFINSKLQPTQVLLPIVDPPLMSDFFTIVSARRDAGTIAVLFLCQRFREKKPKRKCFFPRTTPSC
jgi:hypothetical protein